MQNSRRVAERSTRQMVRRWFRNCLIAGLAGAGLLGVNGCTRAKYRSKVDTEVSYLLNEKKAESCEVNMASKYDIQVDPRSRMFDPFNPDRPPMPEDDPQSNRYMRLVDHKKGYPLWEGNGRTNQAENPEWVQHLPLDERGVLVLNLEEAVRLAILHSPTYQRNLEEVFLSALDVSTERFQFDSQFFGGWSGGYAATGPFRNQATTPSPRSTWTTGPASEGSRGLFMQKQFTTGADFVAGVANNIQWQIVGPGSRRSATTLLDFSLVQPLLRQAGRDVVLERLTLAERTLLANVRAFERYRRAFYVQVAVGLNPDTTPARRGGVFGGSGFSGFTGLGGGFGTLGNTNAGGNAGGGLAGNNAAPGAAGFFGLLQDQLNILNQQENVAQLTDIYLQLRDNYNELLLTVPDSQIEVPQQKLQVIQALQNIYNQQTTLLQAQSAWQDSLDNLKGTMGLPPYLCVEIRDPLLDRFRLVSSELRDRRGELATLRAVLGDHNTKIIDLSTVERDPQTRETFRALKDLPSLKTEMQAMAKDLQPLDQIRKNIVDSDVAEVRDDIAKLRAATPQRRKQLNRLKEIVKSEEGMVCGLLPTGTLNLSFLDGEGLEQLPDDLTKQLDDLVKRFDKHGKTFETLYAKLSSFDQRSPQFKDERERFSDISDSVILGSQGLLAEINDDLLALQIIQARARTEAALLPEVDIDPREALEIARINRQDWLNNRASLVNSWRAIEVVADTLESFLDLTVSGDVQNYGNNPLALRGNTGRMSMGLEWDAPITRLQERNNYRQSLIEYQRAKRTYYRFEDGVWQSMRTTLRTIRQRQLSFEIQRFAVQTATQQISVNADIRQINETLGQVSPTAARDAVTALSDLLTTQNNLIGTFVNYEALRRSLDLNMGTMQIDSEGIWIDPGPIRADTMGGVFGESVMTYGMTEEEKLLRNKMLEQGNLPIELAPSDHLPPAVVNTSAEIPVEPE